MLGRPASAMILLYVWQVACQKSYRMSPSDRLATSTAVIYGPHRCISLSLRRFPGANFEFQISISRNLLSGYLVSRPYQTPSPFFTSQYNLSKSGALRCMMWILHITWHDFDGINFAWKKSDIFSKLAPDFCTRLWQIITPGALDLMRDEYGKVMGNFGERVHLLLSRCDKIVIRISMYTWCKDLEIIYLWSGWVVELN